MIAALLIALALSAAPAAQDLPPFTVTTATGQVVAGAALLAGERKVVVYVAPELDPAARLVDALKQWSRDDPRWRGRVIVIVAAPAAESLAWLTARWGEGELPVWVADPDAAGWRALGFQGTVGVAGVEHGAIDWKLDGVINDPAVVEPSIRVWTGIEAR
jgi:hypothetical protein